MRGNDFSTPFFKLIVHIVPTKLVWFCVDTSDVSSKEYVEFVFLLHQSWIMNHESFKPVYDLLLLLWSLDSKIRIPYLRFSKVFFFLLWFWRVHSVNVTNLILENRKENIFKQVNEVYFISRLYDTKYICWFHFAPN